MLSPARRRRLPRRIRLKNEHIATLSGFHSMVSGRGREGGRAGSGSSSDSINPPAPPSPAPREIAALGMRRCHGSSPRGGALPLLFVSPLVPGTVVPSGTT